MASPDIFNEPPTGPVRDLAMALVGALPFGSLWQLLAGKLWDDPRCAAYRHFAIALAKRLRELEQTSSLDIGDALQKPETQPLLLSAFETAARSIGEKKLEALRNAAVQGIFERSYPFDLSVLVFSLLDRVTEGHLVLLHFIASGGLPGKLPPYEIDVTQVGITVEMRRASDATIIAQQITLNELILHDLINMGLVTTRLEIGPVHTWSTDASRNAPARVVLTKKGKLFVEHIFPAAIS
ncbi:hypothetical protein [Rhizobium sp. GN54]|uniref:hypothetical protein n=1 Tax=Rhizobium sp. GN54 TaxID=2898150 RepID=UPI001E362D52|nr:hypothetical protein [Rhizobium sp. GN54]MCD2183107.1 hypothetical protein [Rhizobium sp. GN54]